MLKLLVVQVPAEVGGAEVTLLRFLEAFPRDRLTVQLVVFSPGSVAEQARRTDVEVHVLASQPRLRNGLTATRRIAELARIIRQWNADVVFSNGTMSHLFGAPAALLARRPYTWRLCDMLAPGSSVVYRIAAALPSEAVIADSNAVAAAGARFWPRVRRIRTIYPGVGLPSGVGVGLRTEIGVPADTQLVAVVGRLQRWKGQEDFLEAATLIAAEHASAHFLVVGGPMFGLDPGFPEELRAKAARSSVNGRVHFLGPRSDVERLLPELDVLVVPSRTPEPFGTIQIEAMAAGVPVVSTAAGGNIEVVDDGVCGYLVPPRDPRLISEAVIRLLADPALCRSMGESGRVRVKNRFSLDRMVDEMCQVFESVAG